MQKVINKGFTLIELLVVIAIIGILAAIVLVSLGNARQKGADAGIQGNLDSIRTQAEVYASNNSNSYIPGGSALATTTAAGSSSTCLTQAASANLFGDATVKQALVAAQSTSGGNVICVANANYWSAAVVLKTDTSQAWCVSSNGQAKSISTTNLFAAGGSHCL